MAGAAAAAGEATREGAGEATREDAGGHSSLCLRAVGLDSEALSSRRAHQISRGELAQLNLARKLAAAIGAPGASPPPGLVLADEFGSAWDAQRARRVAAALSNALRAGGAFDGLRLVLAGCHCDLVGASALEADWVFEAASATCLWFEHPFARLSVAFEGGALDGTGPRGEAASPLKGESLGVSVGEEDDLDVWTRCAERLPRDSAACGRRLPLDAPKLALWLAPCEQQEWRRFRRFHYKSEHLSAASECFLLRARLADGTVSPTPTHAVDSPTSVVSP